MISSSEGWRMMSLKGIGKKEGGERRGGGSLRNFKCHQTENLNHSLATLAPCFLKSLLSVGIKLTTHTTSCGKPLFVVS